jgi:hypothetical protein
LAFEPPNTVAAIGDTVAFVFSPKAHSVTQSSFGAPCRPLADTSNGQEVGFDSGLTPVTAPGQATFRIKVNDTKPIWGYCRQVGHCGQGMVFSINADQGAPKSFTAFQALAKKLNGTQTQTSTQTVTMTSDSGMHYRI